MPPVLDQGTTVRRVYLGGIEGAANNARLASSGIACRVRCGNGAASCKVAADSKAGTQLGRSAAVDSKAGAQQKRSSRQQGRNAAGQERSGRQQGRSAAGQGRSSRRQGRSAAGEERSRGDGAGEGTPPYQRRPGRWARTVTEGRCADFADVLDASDVVDQRIPWGRVVLSEPCFEL